MSSKKIKFGTRGSLLARTQTQKVIEQLRTLDKWDIEMVIIKTEGDDYRNSIFNPIRPGVFVSALRDSLLSGEVDVIVHSYKDLPSAQHEGVTLAAVPEREDCRDVLISKDQLKFEDLLSGSTIGTSSPRRKSFVKFNRPDLSVKPLRGNVDSRLEKLMSAEYDAIIMAAAGIKRIEKSNQITQFLALTELIPAPAQGALAVECRSADLELIELLGKINNAKASLETYVERSFLAKLGASCETAVGAVAVFNETERSIDFFAELMDENGEQRERRQITIKSNLTNLASIKNQAEAIANEILNTDLARKIFS